MRVIYVAGRFRGQTPWAVAENVRAAERVGLEVARLGAMPLIPQANTALFDGQLTSEFWIAGTMELLRRCDAAVLVPGWESSVGTRGEIEDAVSRGVPVFENLRGLAAWLAGGASAGILGHEDGEWVYGVIEARAA